MVKMIKKHTREMMYNQRKRKKREPEDGQRPARAERKNGIDERLPGERSMHQPRPLFSGTIIQVSLAKVLLSYLSMPPTGL